MNGNRGLPPVTEKDDSRATRVLTHPIAWVPALVGGILVLLEPSWLIDNKLILLLAKFAATYTGINALASNNSSPGGALAFYAIVFSAFPFQLVLLWRKWVAYRCPELMVKNMTRQPYSKRLWLIALAPLGVAVGYFGIFWVANDPSFCIGCTTNNRVGMVVITALGILAETFVCLATLTLLINARKILSRAPR